MKKFSLLLLVFSIMVCCKEESCAQQKLEESALKEDFSIYKDIIVELAPKLTEESKKKVYDTLNNRMNDLNDQRLNAFEFFKFIVENQPSLGNDEHAEISLPENVFLPFLMKSKLFPIPIKMIGRQVCVNSNETEIPFGSVIRSINKIDIDTILGYFIEKKGDSFAKLNTENQFSFLYLLKIGSSEEFIIEYQKSLNSDSILRKTISGVTPQQWSELMNNRIYPVNKENIKQPLSIAFIQDSKTVYFQLNSFELDGTKNEYRSFKKHFNQLFNKIKATKTTNLIIDLRYNGGGDSRIPALLYSYLAKETFKETITLQMPSLNFPQKNYIIALDGKQINTSEDIERFTEEIKSALTEKDGKYVGIIADEKKIKPKKNAFKGNTYLLIGGGSLSASSYFTSLFKAYQRGIIIGEQIGGSHIDMTAGKSITYELPNTQISITVPLMFVQFSPEIQKKVPERKIVPDIELSTNDMYQYFLKKDDAELEEVLKLIKP